jgi:hypothetical protein
MPQMVSRGKPNQRDESRLDHWGNKMLHALDVCLFSLSTCLLPVAFTGQRLLESEFLSRLQVKGVSFDFPNDVFLYHLPLETTERVFQRLPVLKLYLSQMATASIRPAADLWSVFTTRWDFSDAIIWPLRVPQQIELPFPSIPCRA